MNRYKNTITIIAVMVLGFGALIWFTRSQQPENGAGKTINGLGPADLTVEINQYDFGEVSMARGKVSYDYKIRNSGSEPVVVTKIYTSCMCTTAELLKGSLSMGPYGMPGHGTMRLNETVNPGEEATIRTVFDPTAHGPAGVGPVERAVYVEQKSGEVLELRFRATVTP